MVKTGDKVRFLDDKGGGTVTTFINKNTVNVEIDGGFEIPYPVSQLVVVNKSGHENNAKNETKRDTVLEPITKPVKPEVKIYKGKDNPDFYFCFVPQNSSNTTSSGIELFLVNDSNFTLLFHFSTISAEGYSTKKYGSIHPNTKHLLYKIAGNEISSLPEFGFQILWFSSEGQFQGEPVVKKFKINPLKLFKETMFQTNRFFDKKALISRLRKTFRKQN